MAKCLVINTSVTRYICSPVGVWMAKIEYFNE